jgi:hypothetical protein
MSGIGFRRVGVVASFAIVLVIVLSNAALAHGSVAGGESSAAGIRTPSSLSLDFVVPEGYTLSALRAAAGSWQGPPYIARGASTPSGNSTITWKAQLARKAASIDQAARAGLGHRWETVEAGVVFVAHRSDQRTLGTIPASYLLTRGSVAGQYEMAIAIPLGRAQYTVIRLSSNAPAGAAEAAAGAAGAAGAAKTPYLVEGITADVWNARALRQIAYDIALIGNLWPQQITIGTGGSRLNGRVTDAFGQPLVAFRVAVQRRVSGSWRTVAHATSDQQGRFRLVPRQPGVYRFEGRLGGVVVRSRPLTSL